MVRQNNFLFETNLVFSGGLRIDYLDRPTARRFVIVRPQDNTTKGRTSRSSSVSSASSARSSKDRLRSVSNDDQPDTKTSNRQTRSPSGSPPPSKRRSLSPPTVGHTFYGPLGSYFSSDETNNVNNVNDLMTFCEKLNSSSIKNNPNSSSVYPVQFNLKSHAYEARMHFLAGNPQLTTKILGSPGDQKSKSTELKVTQRLRLDQHKLEELEKKIRTNVGSISSKSNGNGQTSNSSLANQTNFAVLIASPSSRNRKSNGKANSSDENDDRSQTRDDDDESSLSHLISYLSG